MAQDSKVRRSYLTVEAIALTGIKKDMLHYLCRVGIVVPTTSRRAGKTGYGIQRRYSFSDLISFKVVKRLTESGVSPMKVKAAIKELHEMGISLQKLPASRVVIVGKSVYRWEEGDPFRVVDGQQAFGFILDLGQIKDELVADIAKLAA